MGKKNEEEAVRVIDVNDPLFEMLANLPQDKMLELMRRDMERYKAKKRAEQAAAKEKTPPATGPDGAA